MIQRVRSHASLAAFGLGVATIYAVAFAIVARLGQLDDPDLIAGALTLDLTLLVPLLYYLLVVRPRAWSMITVLPVFVASVLLAEWLIPREQHQVLDLIGYGAVLAEVALVSVIAYKAVQLRARYRERAASGAGVYESLRESACAVLGPRAGAALAYEAAVFYYAFAGWSRSPRPDEKSFTIHRSGGYTALMIAVAIALVVETAALHLLLRLWSPTVAWIFTGISAYTLIWLIGDLHAVRLRPLRIAGETLEIRVGLRWTISVPVGAISKVASPVESIEAGRRDHVKAVLVGAPNRRLELAEPVDAVGLYGLTRRVKTIDLQIDDPGRFDAALDARP